MRLRRAFSSSGGSAPRAPERRLGSRPCALRASALVPGGAILVTSATARAGDPAAAREQVKIGYELAQQGKCEEAIPHFVESIKLDIKAVTLINLAACEEKTGKLADALGHWVEARSRAQAEGNNAILEEAEKKAKALEPRLPKLTVTLAAGAPSEAEVVRDGVVLGQASMGVPLPVNPGAHTLVVKAKGFEDTSTQITIAEAEAKKIELKVGAKKAIEATSPIGPTPGPETSSGGLSPLVPIGFGVGIAGVAVGAITGIVALGAASDAKSQCPEGKCTTPTQKSDAESGKTMGTVSTIAFIVGGLGAAVGVYGLVWGTPKSSASVAVSLGPTGGVVGGTF